jgi:hypothetical protein
MAEPEAAAADAADAEDTFDDYTLATPWERYAVRAACVRSTVAHRCAAR